MVGAHFICQRPLDAQNEALILKPFQKMKPIFIFFKINFLVPNKPNDLLVFKLDSSI